MTEEKEFSHPAHIEIEDNATKWDKRADKLAGLVGSWKFLAIQTTLIVVWILINIIGVFGLQWDPYPFILLNLCFSTQAAYAAPILQLSGNRAASHDRLRAEHDYDINKSSLEEIRSNTILTVAVKELVEEIRNNKN